VGTTDSEQAFCHLMERLRAKWAEPPELEALFEEVARLSAEIRANGVFNFMLSNGEALFAHCSTQLHYIIRCAPFNTAHLVDDDVSLDFAAVTTPRDQVAMIATQPLTDNEHWTALSPGELILFRDGAPLLIRKAD
ncbi:class II glutamine amidotransferase, partial [Pseudomonas sp. MWU13-2625]